ncbi:MAG: 4-hydroxy-3-methylbut-2-enyl diphosphate reductase [Bacteroidales bacterium]|nr:4-hydroxy-3-methylbut-2-enyl diphosphate reductase [Bacteroidales bacterium]
MLDKLNLKVEIDENSGFCFGVINAIEKAEAYLSDNEELYCLGEIVHNEEEIKRLENQGIVTIDKEKLKNLKDSIVLFRAHGEPPDSYLIAKANNIKVIDASCPIILSIQKQIVASYKSNEKIYIYGKKNHPEIAGLIGQIDNNAVVFEKINDLNLKELPQKITLYSQTTMSLSKFYEIVEQIKNKGIELKVKDTICRQVADREGKLKKFCENYNVVIFVAGKHSSNGRVLFDVCKNANPNTYFVSSDIDIRNQWFKSGESVGICGATSTPMWLMNKVKEKLLFL